MSALEQLKRHLENPMCVGIARDNLEALVAELGEREQRVQYLIELNEYMLKTGRIERDHVRLVREAVAALASDCEGE